LIVLRCTSKLLDKLSITPRVDHRASSNALGDWYATLLRSKRGQFVLAVARETLLPIVVSGRELRTFPERLASTLGDVLAVYGVGAGVIEHECAAMSEVTYARTDDRSTVGVLTELQRLLHGDLEYFPNAALTDLSLRLAHTPVVARNVFPDDATCRLFGVAARNDRRHEFGN
jgi:Domain of unknown function (DUF6933)